MKQPSRKKAIEMMCADCAKVQPVEPCDCVMCPLYYWLPTRDREPDLSWSVTEKKKVGRPKKEEK